MEFSTRYFDKKHCLMRMESENLFVLPRYVALNMVDVIKYPVNSSVRNLTKCQEINEPKRKKNNKINSKHKIKKDLVQN